MWDLAVTDHEWQLQTDWWLVEVDQKPERHGEALTSSLDHHWPAHQISHQGCQPGLDHWKLLLEFWLQDQNTGTSPGG